MAARATPLVLSLADSTVNLDKQLSKLTRQTASTFAPRPSGKTKNPAVKGSVLYNVRLQRSLQKLCLLFNLSSWAFVVPGLCGKGSGRGAVGVLAATAAAAESGLTHHPRMYSMVCAAECLKLVYAVHEQSVQIPSCGCSGRRHRASSGLQHPSRDTHRCVSCVVLLQVFEVQAWLAVVVGGLLSYNVIFPTDEPSIARLMGMWSIW
jgi:hypothetical protein